jgi:hypothetical protein
MRITAKVFSGSNTPFKNKDGQAVAKTRLKVVDMGDELDGAPQTYWIDFVGDYALNPQEVQALQKQMVEIDIQYVTASTGKDGKAYLNVRGGFVYLDGKVYQTGHNTLQTA